MMLAELSGLEIGGIICGMVFGAGAMLISIIAVNKKQEVRVDQPVQVTITEELHKVFAAKESFDRHVAENQRQHQQFEADLKTDRKNNEVHISTRQKTLFDEVKSTRESLEQKLDQKHQENSRRLNEVEKSIGGLEATTEMQNQQLAGIQSDIKLLLQRRA